MVIASAYFTGNNNKPVEVQELVKHCSRKNIPLIIGCDANAHNDVWGRSDSIMRGEYTFLSSLLKKTVLHLM